MGSEALFTVVVGPGLLPSHLMSTVVLGLGGNLGSTREAFERVLGDLSATGAVPARSRLYRSRAVGPPQPDYLNAAVLLDWPGDLRSLLERCHELEAAAGRDRSREERWGPRPVDLDLLIAGGVVCRGPRLVLPHPRLHSRAFALLPAAEVAGEWLHPHIGLTLQALAEAILAHDPGAILGPPVRW